MTPEQQKLIDMMRQAFATNFTFYLEAHNAHWNVAGSAFPQYHHFLERLYSDAQDAIDDYAEAVRELYAFAQGTYPEIIQESLLTDPTGTPTDPVEIFSNLTRDNDILIAHLQDTFDQATVCREYGLQNFLADRIAAHKKSCWQMRAILGETP
jgi:starvation-inducible DNA-binding protein